MERLAAVLLFAIALTAGGYLVGNAQAELAHFKLTVTTTDRGAGVKMTCERGCAWKELSFGCDGKVECSGHVDEYGLGDHR